MSTDTQTPTAALTQTNDPKYESIAAERDLDKRSVRAVMNDMDVVRVAGSETKFRVYNAHGDRYEVDLAFESCTCPDHEHNLPAGGCKHVRRAALEAGRESFDRRRFVSSAVDNVKEIDEQIKKLEADRAALAGMLNEYRELDGKKSEGR